MTSSKKETKRERFARLGTKRTNEILERIRILGGCANRRMYDYTDNDTNQIFRAIEKERKRVKLLFTENKKEEFRLEV